MEHGVYGSPQGKRCAYQVFCRGPLNGGMETVEIVGIATVCKNRFDMVDLVMSKGHGDGGVFAK